MYYLLDFCCICFYNKEHLFRLSESNGDNITYLIKLTSFVPEMYFNEMNDQRLVCKTCCEVIDAAYKFRQKCLRSKTTLTDYISKLHKFSRISGAVNVYLNDINKFDVIQTEFHNGNNMESVIGKTELFKTVDKDEFVKENSESYLETQIKIEPSPIHLKVCESENNHLKLENVTIKMEIKNQPSEEHAEEIYDPLGNLDDVRVNLSQNDMKFAVSEIKNESENHDIEKSGSFNNTYEMCANFSDINTELENSDHLVKYSNDLKIHQTMNIDVVKVDIVNNDIELIDSAIYMENKSENTEKILKDYSPFEGQDEDETNKGDSLFQKIKEEKQKEAISKIQVKKMSHMRTHTENTHECNVCQKKFNQSYYLTKHMIIHTGEKPYECEICGKKFYQVGNLTSHKLIHTREQPHKCIICKRKFSHLNSLARHMKIHPGEEPYECYVCKKKFSVSNHLTKHMLIHTRENGHECSICQRKFQRSSRLSRHMKTHTGEKSHECEICAKKFRQLVHLSSHMLIHTREKPHECIICRRKFTHLNSMTRHMKLHPGEKSYECSACKKNFSVFHHLTKHMLIHAREIGQECTI